MKTRTLFLILFSVLVAVNCMAQVSNITIQWAHPSFDCETKEYCVDIEYSTDQSADTLYGTNVRFFYNSEVLTFKEFTDFVDDYGLVNDIEVVTGVGSSGASLFNFPSGDAATWVNAGIQLKNQNAGAGMTQGQFTRYFSICFDINGEPEELIDFCPELIWDLEEDGSKGGFFSGNDGVVITLKESDQSTIANEVVQHLNWAYTGSGTAPYGSFSASIGGCITNDCVTCVAPNTAPTLKGK